MSTVTQPRLPTRQNVSKVLKNFEAKEGLVYLSGQVVVERDDTDVEQPFRQESNFFYVTGIYNKLLFISVFIYTNFFFS